MKNRIKKQTISKPPVCPYCGQTAVLKRVKDLYGGDTKWIPEEFIYVCKSYPACNSYVSTKRGTKIPKGTMADGDLRYLRICAHKIFDKIWLSGFMSQAEAYRWIQAKFNLNEKDAHIGQMSNYMCKKLIEACNDFLDKNHVPKVS